MHAYLLLVKTTYSEFQYGGRHLGPLASYWLADHVHFSIHPRQAWGINDLATALCCLKVQ